MAWPLEDQSPNALELIEQGQVDLVVNVPKDATEQELQNDYMIRPSPQSVWMISTKRLLPSS